MALEGRCSAVGSLRADSIMARGMRSPSMGRRYGCSHSLRDQDPKSLAPDPLTETEESRYGLLGGDWRFPSTSASQKRKVQDAMDLDTQKPTSVLQ